MTFSCKLHEFSGEIDRLKRVQFDLPMFVSRNLECRTTKVSKNYYDRISFFKIIINKLSCDYKFLQDK